MGSAPRANTSIDAFIAIALVLVGVLIGFVAASVIGYLVAL